MANFKQNGIHTVHDSFNRCDEKGSSSWSVVVCSRMEVSPMIHTRRFISNVHILVLMLYIDVELPSFWQITLYPFCHLYDICHKSGTILDDRTFEGT